MANIPYKRPWSDMNPDERIAEILRYHDREIETLEQDVAELQKAIKSSKDRRRNRILDVLHGRQGNSLCRQYTKPDVDKKLWKRAKKIIERGGVL